MECVVDDGAPIGEIVIIGKDAIEGMPDMLRGKRNDRRGTAKHRGCGGALEVVGVEQAPARYLFDVGMRINAAGRDDSVSGINFRDAWAKSLAYSGNGLVPYTDVATHNAFRQNHRPIPHNYRVRLICHRGIFTFCKVCHVSS
jgi:hypothetical protein